MKKIMLLIGWMSGFQGVQGSVLERLWNSREEISNEELTRIESFSSEEAVWVKGAVKDIRENWEKNLIKAVDPWFQKILAKTTQKLQAIEASFPFLVESLNPIYEQMKTIKLKQFCVLKDFDQEFHQLKEQIDKIAKALEGEETVLKAKLLERSNDQTFKALDEFQRDLSSVEPFCSPIKILKERMLKLSLDLGKGREALSSFIEDENKKMLETFRESKDVFNKAIVAIGNESKATKEEYNFWFVRSKQRERLETLYNAIFNHAYSDLYVIQDSFSSGEFFDNESTALDIAELKAQQEELGKVLEEYEQILHLEAKSYINLDWDFEGELENRGEKFDDPDSQEKRNQIEELERTRPVFQEWKQPRSQALATLQKEIADLETSLGDRISQGFSAVEARNENERKTARDESERLRSESETVRMESERICVDSDRIRVEFEKAKKKRIVALRDYKKAEEDFFPHHRA